MFSHWKESFQFFSKNNIKIFILATLNNFQRSLRILIKNFWWQIILFILFKLLTHDYAYFFQSSSQTAWSPLILRSLGMGGFVVASLYMLFFFVLSVRPSIEIKNYAYFNRYQQYLWGFFILYLSIYFLSIPYFFPFAILSTFFFTDLKSTPLCFSQSLKNGVLCFLNFLPIIGLFFVLYGAGIILSYKLDGLVYNLLTTSSVDGNIIEKLLYVVLLPIVATILTTLMKFLYIASLGIYYIKLKHQYHSLFFKK